MNYQFPGFVIVYIIATVLCFFSALMVLRRRVNPGSVPFALAMLSMMVWSLGAIFDAGATTVEGKIFWSKVQYLGVTTVSPFWLIFTSYYANRRKTFSGALRWLIWIIPALTLILTYTNEIHHLVWSKVTVLDDGLFTGLYEHGIVYYIHLFYSYFCLLLGSVWVIIDIFRGEKTRRFQSIIFITSVVLALVGSLIYNLKVFPIPGFDLTPVAISFVAILLAWSISRFRVFDLVPIARTALLSSMRDGMIVIDPNDIVLEVNPAALEITQYDGPSPVGRSVWTMMEKYSERIEPLRNRTNFIEEITFPEHKDRTIQIQVTSIERKGKNLSGQLIVLRDITKRIQAEQTEKEQREFVEVLADTAAIINRSLDLDDVLELILENVGKVVPHDSANIALMTDHGQAKFVKVTNEDRYQKKDYLTGLNINVLGIKNFRTMADTCKPLIVSDTHAEGQWTDNLEKSKWIRSFLGAPIIHQGTLLGFIDLDSDKKDHFTQKDAERLDIFTNYAATAIANARNYAEIKFYAEEMAILYEISLAIAAGVGLEKTTQAVFRQLKRVIPVDLFYLALYEPANQRVSYFMYRDEGARVDVKPFNLYRQPSMTRYVMEKKETVYIPDFRTPNAELDASQVILLPGYDGRSSLGVPLILRGEVIGVLSVQCKQPDAYSSRQIRLVETIAQQATIAMDNAKLFERMQELAITDGLTNLYNRRYFYMVLENEIERTLRYQTPLSLIMMDIDHFKTVNDRFGHLAGDEVLQSIAALCKSLLRQSDVMFRYGGEEFIVLLPETNAEMAHKVAERIRVTIADAEFETKKGTVKISISFGVSQFSEDLSNANLFIESADQALYHAKQTGRNCVRVFRAEED